MDEVEKNIIRRRRADLTDCLDVNKELLMDMKVLGLITLDHIQVIDQERTIAGKVDRIVDAILQIGPPDGFQNFCKLLSKTSPSLTADLQVELGLERGVIQPRPEMIQEASALVNRKFARSRRFNEADRKDIIELIAAKLQLSHDEWRREADKLQTKLDKTRSESISMDDRSVRATKLLADFARRYQTEILMFSADKKQTSSLLKRMMSKSTADSASTVDTLEQLQVNMKELFTEVESILDHRDQLYSEKERCLRLLDISDDKVQLDDVLGKITGLSITSNLKIEKKDDIIVRLEQEVTSLDEQADNYEKILEELRVAMAMKEREMANLRRNVYIE